MNIVTKTVNLVLYTSLFAACCATGLCMATERLLLNDIPSVCSTLHAFIFGSTLLVYNTHYLIKKSDGNISDRFAWSQHHKLWHYLFWTVGAAICGISIFHLNSDIRMACIVLGILSFAYSLPLLPIGNKRRLKDFGRIKILVLTGVWTIVTSVLPILYWQKSIGDYPYEIMLRFVFMFTLCVAFDIRDMQTDIDAGIVTLPNVIGVNNSYRLMYAALILFAVLSVVQYFRYPSAVRLTGELLTSVATAAVIAYTRKHPSDKAYLGLIDGMMLLYALLVLWH